jgi:membrane protein DedA with SNARE-associated domain
MGTAIAANIVTDASEWLSDFSANWWFLLIIFAVAFLDSIIPAVPGETSVIIGGVAAGAGEQSLLLVIVAGAAGAFLGDNTAYSIGALLSGRIERYASHRPKFQKRLDWAQHQIRLRGGILLITARFIPGGRSAMTISSGITRQPRRWFMGWIAVAAVIWATYAALLGYIGGKAFEDNHTKAFLLAFVTALSATILIEVVRHFWGKWRGAQAVEEIVDELEEQTAPSDGAV